MWAKDKVFEKKLSNDYWIFALVRNSVEFLYLFSWKNGGMVLSIAGCWDTEELYKMERQVFLPQIS